MNECCLCHKPTNNPLEPINGFYDTYAWCICNACKELSAKAEKEKMKAFRAEHMKHNYISYGINGKIKGVIDLYE
jgi:hypothetical protein